MLLIVFCVHDVVQKSGMWTVNVQCGGTTLLKDYTERDIPLQGRVDRIKRFTICYTIAIKLCLVWMFDFKFT